MNHHADRLSKYRTGRGHNSSVSVVVLLGETSDDLFTQEKISLNCSVQLDVERRDNARIYLKLEEAVSVSGKVNPFRIRITRRSYKEELADNLVRSLIYGGIQNRILEHAYSRFKS